MKYRFYSKRTLGSHDFACLTLLYEPLFGQELIQFYYRLWSVSSALGSWSLRSCEQLLGVTNLVTQLEQLQAISLVNMFPLQDITMVELQLPMNELEFFHTTNQTRALVEKVGAERVQIIRDFFFPWGVASTPSSEVRKSEFPLELLKAAYQYLEYPEFFPPFLQQESCIRLLEKFMGSNQLDFATLFRMIEAEKFPLGKDFVDSPEMVITKLTRRLKRSKRCENQGQSLEKLLLEYRQESEKTELSPEEIFDIEVIRNYTAFTEDILVYVVDYAIKKTNYQLNLKYIKKVIDSMVRAKVRTLEDAKQYLNRTVSKKTRTSITKISGFTDEDFL